MIIYNSNGIKIKENREYMEWLKHFIEEHEDQYEIETKESTKNDFYLPENKELDFNN